MWKVILIDDEEIALDVMDIMLAEVGGVKVVGRFQLVAEALEQCGALQPDLIFLDIEMPGVSGLEVAEEITACFPFAKIVFVTAHDQYAIDAYDTDAIGYLLKPVAKDKLARTLHRYSNLQAKNRILSSSPLDLDRGVANVGSSELDTVVEGKVLLSLKVLGSMELYAANGRLLTWRTKKTKELFAFLWHHRGQPVYKYAILENLWPNDAPERGQKLLHTSLYYLRSLFKSVGYGEVVRYGDERYWINPVFIRSDLEELLGRMKRGVAGTEAKDMLHLYSGNYFEMEHYEWADTYRIELRSILMSYLTNALNGATNEPRIAMLRKLIDLEPSREGYYDLLIDSLRHAGDLGGVGNVQALKKRMLLEEN
ncbi:response regulator [Paenibacillus sp. 276b]|uniref:response regulator n=1 Tax=Paenibacillus sp. 276b TaxID=1566277 RepID=UPI00089C2C0E|nr:response regulator [Paenibacillus sp. 276b]SEB01151.1 Two-component response regulator, SAPR family, consists of REC, wHTH and BTAD domains [Paenibacillus sp. 276b]